MQHFVAVTCKRFWQVKNLQQTSAAKCYVKTHLHAWLHGLGFNALKSFGNLRREKRRLIATIACSIFIFPFFF